MTHWIKNLWSCIYTTRFCS